MCVVVVLYFCVHGAGLACDCFEHGVGAKSVHVSTGVGEGKAFGNALEGEGGVEGESSDTISMLMVTWDVNVNLLSRQGFQDGLLLVVRIRDAQVKHLVESTRTQQSLV